jgi:hypothetical protein
MFCKHSLVLSQSTTDNDANATAIAIDYMPPHEHLEASDFVGFIIITTVIIFGLTLWGFLSLWAKRGKQQAGREAGENKGLVENTVEDWIKKERGQDVAQEKVLDITQTNEVEYGKE